MLGRRLAEPAVDAVGCTILEVARREVRLYVGQASAGDIMLVPVLAAMIVPRHFLVGLVVLMLMLMMLIMLERLAQVHLHGVVLLACSPVHHDIVGLMAMALIEHAELLRRLPPG